MFPCRLLHSFISRSYWFALAASCRSQCSVSLRIPQVANVSPQTGRSYTRHTYTYGDVHRAARIPRPSPWMMSLMMRRWWLRQSQVEGRLQPRQRSLSLAQRRGAKRPARNGSANEVWLCSPMGMLGVEGVGGNACTCVCESNITSPAFLTPSGAPDEVSVREGANVGGRVGVTRVLACASLSITSPAFIRV